ncbi:MAG: hypothetical protein BK997_01765 [Candidatus Micrarchaeum sp. ARMAN-1]|jgi:predicted nucleic acid-binding protein|nr:MAG: hypothetical protein BK997_01765 [Candidatus Micrarchaeum sp. ARMAN-1]
MIGISVNLFFDTSVLVYAFDSSDGVKHKACIELIDKVHSKGEKIAISSQILMELYNVITQYISNPVSADNAAAIVSDFVDADGWIKLEYSALIAKRASLTASRSKIKIWDALIAETMREYGIITIVTENVKDFKKVPGIKVINPFK